MDSPSNEYLRSAVLTASPEQLHLMLYDGAIRFARQGLDGINRKDWEACYNGLTRSQKIVLELLNSLNYEVNRDLCARMAGLYNFIYRKLVDACAQRSPSLAEEAIKLLAYQRETWVMLIEKLNRERAASTAAPAAPEPAEACACYGSLSVEG